MTRSLEELVNFEDFDIELRALVNKYKGKTLVVDIISALEIVKFEQLYFVAQAKIRKYGDPNEPTN